MIVVFLGPPGSGKGTQAKILASDMNWVHLSTGDLFRLAIQSNSELGQKVKGIEQGALISDHLVLELITHQIENIDLEKGLILDGFPRTQAQVQGLEEILNHRNQILDHIVYFEISEAHLITRLLKRKVCSQCGFVLSQAELHQECPCCHQQALLQRKDDQLKIIQDRFLLYYRYTQPLVDYYQRQGKLSKIDAEADPSEVSLALKKVLGLI